MKLGEAKYFMLLNERHEDIVKSLSPYRDQDDIYITFSNVLKVGIKPLYLHETPIGVYTYPLKEIWSSVVSNTIPYAGDRPLVHVLQSTLPVQDVSDYTEAQYQQDREKLLEIFWTLPIANKTERLFQAWETEAKIKIPAAKFWIVTRNMAIKMVGRPTVKWNALLRQLGYNALSDKHGTGLIHPNEPIQAVFLTSAAFKHIATFHNVRRHQVTEIHSIFDLIPLMLKSDFSPKIMKQWGKLLATGQSHDFQLTVKPDELDWTDFPKFLYHIMLRYRLPSAMKDAMTVAYSLGNFSTITDAICYGLDVILTSGGLDMDEYFRKVAEIVVTISNSKVANILKQHASPTSLSKMLGNLFDAVDTLRYMRRDIYIEITPHITALKEVFK